MKGEYEMSLGLWLVERRGGGVTGLRPFGSELRRLGEGARAVWSGQRVGRSAPDGGAHTNGWGPGGIEWFSLDERVCKGLMGAPAVLGAETQEPREEMTKALRGIGIFRRELALVMLSRIVVDHLEQGRARKVALHRGALHSHRELIFLGRPQHPHAIVARKELIGLLPARKHLLRELANEVLDSSKLGILGGAWEEREAEVKLGSDTAERPRVDGGSVVAAEEDFGRAVETRLNVGVDGLTLEACGTKVDEFDARRREAAEEDVLRLEVTVNYSEIGEGTHALETLAHEDADEICREALEVVLLEQFVEVDREQLKDKAEVALEHKVLVHLYDAMRFAIHLRVQEAENACLDQPLVEVGGAVSDHLQSKVLIRVEAATADDLAECSVTDEVFHNVDGGGSRGGGRGGGRRRRIGGG